MSGVGNEWTGIFVFEKNLEVLRCLVGKLII